MKRFLIPVLIIVILLALIPLVFSMKASEAYDNLVSQANKNGALVLKPDQYNKGYLRSSASATVKINWDKMLGERAKTVNESVKNLGFKVSHKILHGPFPEIMDGNFRSAQALIITTLDFSKETKNRMDSLFRGEQPIIFTSWIDLSGDSQTTISANNFTTKNNQDSFMWQGLKGVINYFTSQSRVQSQLDIPLFQLSSQKKGMLNLANLHLDSDTLNDEHGITIGDMNFSMKEFVISKAGLNTGTSGLELKTLVATSQTRTANNKLSSHATFSLKHLTVNSSQFGPAKYDLAISNIDVASIKVFQTEIEKINQSDTPSEQKKSLVAAKIFSLLPAILSQAPRLDIKQISFYFGGEQFNLDATIQINPDLVKKGMPALLLLQALDIEANITLPKSLVAALPKPKSQLKLSSNNTITQAPDRPSASERLERLTQQGYFNSDGRFYRSRVVFRQGKLTLNGLELNPLQVVR